MPKSHPWTPALLHLDVMDIMCWALLCLTVIGRCLIYLSENHFLCATRPDVLTEQASILRRKQLSENTFGTGKSKSRESRTLTCSSDFVAVDVYQYETWPSQERCCCHCCLNNRPHINTPDIILWKASAGSRRSNLAWVTLADCGQFLVKISSKKKKYPEIKVRRG